MNILLLLLALLKLQFAERVDALFLVSAAACLPEVLAEVIDVDPEILLGVIVV